jgi:hypothetical protein
VIGTYNLPSVFQCAGNISALDELIGHEDIVTFVKFVRLRWLRHVERMNNNNA